MAFVHGRHTEIELDSDDLSEFCTTSQLDQEADEHDVTGYGKADYVFAGGLLKGAFSMGGTYDDAATGPKAIIEPLLGTVVTLVRRAEGTGAGKPQESVQVLVKKYTETNPVAGMITWQCDMTKSGPITRTTQGA
ncbi:hypothetical protein ACH4T9_19960 [Micromonospora sp. NPDC020750]|uniref:hypothetical protein n=1 Tax=unclassified Micromonospora TaxID=2617518 RepID=UPI00378CF377